MKQHPNCYRGFGRAGVQIFTFPIDFSNGLRDGIWSRGGRIAMDCTDWMYRRSLSVFIISLNITELMPGLGHLTRKQTMPIPQLPKTTRAAHLG